MELKPMADHVFLRRQVMSEKTESGLYIPEAARKHTEQCEVIAVGPGRVTEAGERVPVAVNVGDVVLLDQKKGAPIRIEGEDLLVVREEVILAVLER